MNDAEDPELPTISHSGETGDEWDTTIRSIAVKLSDHPGFMWAAGSFEVLHADWPAYPHGLQ